MERKCRCIELEERVLKGEDKYNDLESEMKKGKEEFASLEFRFKELESEKLAVEEELRKLKESEEALEFEKHAAMKEAEDWKSKFEKLVETVRKLDEIGAFRYGEMELDENLKLGLELASIKIESRKEGVTFHQILGSPYITTPDKENISKRCGDNATCNKMLVFEGDGCKSTDVVDLSDCATEERSEKECDAINIGEKYEDEDVEANTSTPIVSRKRKLVVTSDSENDDEDNMPISVLKKVKPQNHEMPDLVDSPITEENGPRRSRRVSSRLNKESSVHEEISASGKRNSKQRLAGIPTTGEVEDDDTEDESEGESEGESLDGFIVEDDSHESVSEKSDETREEESDGEVGYADIMSRLRRDKKPKKQKWEYETDMLADFGKDAELCMRAVCVLYRFQTEDERFTSSSHVLNGRGFNKFDAVRGTRIGKFLTDGDPEGDLKKSVEELESFEFDGVEVCRSLASTYSNQLFQIYNNREDPFFTLPPSP